MVRKFTQLFESALQRFTRGGLLTGDLVKFKDSTLRDDFFKSQPENVKAVIQGMIASDLNIRVANIKTKYPAVGAGSNTDFSGTDYTVDVVQELMPGKWVNPITVPAHLLVPIDTYPNLTPIPASVKYDNKIQIKPVEVKPEENEKVLFYKPYNQTHKSDLGGGKMSVGDRTLLNKNVKIPSKPAVGAEDPANYSAKYLPKEKK